MDIPPNHVAHDLSSTETPGDWQPAFYPTYPGECADAQAQPRWEDNEGLPGAYMPAVAFHKYQGPIDGSCRPGERIYAPEFLRSTYVKGFDGSTSQSIASAVVSHDSNLASPSQLAGCFGVHPYQPVPRTGSGMPDPERVATSLGQLRHRKVSGGPATCLTWTSSPPGPTTLPNGSCSSKDMYMVSPRPYPFPEHRPTANPQHGEAEIRSHLGAASMSNVIPEQEKPAGSETAKTGDWRKRTMTGEEL